MLADCLLRVVIGAGKNVITDRFDGLVQRVREGMAILRGGMEPSRVFVVEKKEKPDGRFRSERDRVIAEARLHRGYSRHEIAAHAGLHFSAMGRMVRREMEKARSKT